MTGAAPRILVTLSRRPKPGQPAPGINDRALLRITRNDEDEDGPAYSGRVIKVLPRQKAQILGIFRPLPGGGGRLIPVDKKMLGKELAVAPGDEGGAGDGDLVAVHVAPQKRYGLDMARVRERLGSMKSEKSRQPGRVACPRHSACLSRSGDRGGRGGKACGARRPRGLA